MSESLIGNFVRPDALDFRDWLFRPTLIEVPSVMPLERYRAMGVPVLSQLSARDANRPARAAASQGPGSAERRTKVRQALLGSASATSSPHATAWACTGFALATIAHYLLRRRVIHPDTTHVSEAMLFEMARRYDDYTGEHYLGSSARGAMKGWHMHGVCSHDLWPFKQDRHDRRLTTVRAKDAETRPLGAYYRVNHHDLVAMHCALAEAGVLYAVTRVHSGWLDASAKDGTIRKVEKTLGAHAVAIVAYDNRGFWIQNSWGTDWGVGGFGHLSYDDWLSNGLDVWVARLGVYAEVDEPSSTARITASAPTSSRSQVMRHLRSHLVRIHPDGHLQSNDVYGTSLQDLDTIFEEAFPAMTRTWKGKKRLLLYAPGGLSTLAGAIQRGVADYRAMLLEQQVYPLAFVWRTGLWDHWGTILRRALKLRQPESGIGTETDYLLDRLDDAIEPLARQEGGKLQWDEVKRTAQQATALHDGGVRLTLSRVVKLLKRDPSVEVHVVAHSAGAILMAPAVQLLTSSGQITAGPMKGRQGLGVPVQSCTLWAPACTTALFHQTYFPAILARDIRRFLLLTLTPRAELNDDVAGIYGKSLLYLISNAFESDPRLPDELDDDAAGTELMGMAKHVRRYQEFEALRRRKTVKWMQSPSGATEESPETPALVAARHHGDFDDDAGTLIVSLGHVLNRSVRSARLAVSRSAVLKRRLSQSL